MKRYLALASSLLTGLVTLTIMALAAPPGVINQYNAVCDPAFPQNCASVAADGTLKVTTGSGGALVTGTDDAGLTQLSKVWAFMAGYDGVTEDLIRSGDVNNVAAATGYLDALAVGRYNATLPTLTDTRFGALQIGARGALHTELWTSDNATPIGSATASDAMANSGIGLRNLSLPFVFNGTSWDRLDEVTNGLNSVGTGIPTAGMVGQCDDTSPVAMTENLFGNARINCVTHALLTQPLLSVGGGVTTTYILEPAASDNHATIKNGNGNVYWWSAFNNSATINYIRLYNVAAGFNGCNSATALMWEGMIPASTSGAGFVMNFNTPLTFSTGISICVTGGYGQTNVTAATASAISITVGYN